MSQFSVLIQFMHDHRYTYQSINSYDLKLFKEAICFLILVCLSCLLYYEVFHNEKLFCFVIVHLLNNRILHFSSIHKRTKKSLFYH